MHDKLFNMINLSNTYKRPLNNQIGLTNLSFVLAAAEGEMCSVDLALIVDKTQSVGTYHFGLLKGFLLQLSDAMDISPNTTNEAVITFANVSTVLNTFADSEYHSNEAMHLLIESIDDNLGRPTRTDRALVAANEKLFTEEGGDRPDFPNSLVLFTDGKTNPLSQPYDEIIPFLEVGNGRYKGFSILARGPDTYIYI